MRYLVLFGIFFRSLGLVGQSVPPLINYQGRLANVDGTPFPTADYELRVALYDAATNGAMVWGPQLFDGASGVGHGPRLAVVQGYFNMTLGPFDTQRREILQAFSGTNRFVEISVSNRPPVLPRQQIMATPFAVQAANGSPPGTIVAFGGTVVPEGWLLCDGSALDKESAIYRGLYTAILTNWGNGSTNPVGATFAAVAAEPGRTDFNVPDLRGYFLRGVSGLTARDPDRATRQSILAGGAGGNNVGSGQNHLLMQHNHVIRKSVSSTIDGADEYVRTGYPSSSRDSSFLGLVNNTPDGGAETRPLNVYVNYIIKY